MSRRAHAGATGWQPKAQARSERNRQRSSLPGVPAIPSRLNPRAGGVLTRHSNVGDSPRPVLPIVPAMCGADDGSVLASPSCMAGRTQPTRCAAMECHALKNIHCQQRKLMTGINEIDTNIILSLLDTRKSNTTESGANPIGTRHHLLSKNIRTNPKKITFRFTKLLR